MEVLAVVSHERAEPSPSRRLLRFGYVGSEDVVLLPDYPELLRILLVLHTELNLVHGDNFQVLRLKNKKNSRFFV